MKEQNIQMYLFIYVNMPIFNVLVFSLTISTNYLLDVFLLYMILSHCLTFWFFSLNHVGMLMYHPKIFSNENEKNLENS